MTGELEVKLHDLFSNCAKASRPSAQMKTERTPIALTEPLQLWIYVSCAVAVMLSVQLNYYP